MYKLLLQFILTIEDKMIYKSWDINSELTRCHVDKFDDSFNDLVREHFEHILISVNSPRDQLNNCFFKDYDAHCKK